MKCLFVFNSTRAVIKAENLCKEAGAKIKIIPVPRSISSECGMAIEIADFSDKDEIIALLTEAQIDHSIHTDYIL